MKTLDETTFSPAGDNGWLVLKFGGTSVSSPDRWETIRDLIQERVDAGYRVLVVHSALAGVSDRLQELLKEAVSGDCEERLATLLELHFTLSLELGLDGPALLHDDVEELRGLLAQIHTVGHVRPSVHARVLALGELMATRLGAAWLHGQGLTVTWLDAREILSSKEHVKGSARAAYLSAGCDFDLDPDCQARLSALPGTVLTQGFIAANHKGETVLLGRGGSDTSASYLAAKLGAVGLEIWTDVAGVFSANPRIVTGARQLKVLSYQEAQEIAFTGGSVLHPRSISPLRRDRIPLRIRCTAQPELAGTLIARDLAGDAPGVKAISGRTGITLISMETLGMWHEVGFLADAFRCFSDLGLSIDLVSTSECSVTVTLDTRAQAIEAGTLDELTQRLESLCRVHIIEQAEVVSLVGQKIRAILHEIGPAMEVFEEHRIHLVSQAANDLNLSFVVGEDQAQRLIQKLHATLVRPAQNDAVFGRTWEELKQGEVTARPGTEPWWVRKRSRLLEIATVEDAAYVYDLDTVRGAADRLQGLDGVRKVFYALKANSHPDILRVVRDVGLSLECVSAGELRLVLELFPGIDRQRILFTPNFAPREEYEYAFCEKVWVTLDNLYPLDHWAEMFSGREILLRLDTGQGRGHHRHVRTEGSHTKFGIPMFELEEVRRLVESCGATVVGLHAHSGSGILKEDHWSEVAATLLDAAREFPAARYVNLGGGLGVPEMPGQPVLDLGALNEGLKGIRRNGDLELWLEPGRYLVAEAGVLVTRVTQIKGKGHARYVGVATGMNSLIRPALYGSHHEIVNLSRLDEPGKHVVSIVGPICESADLLGSERLLPECREGDVLLVANAGAYGFVMSSRYNLREPAREFAI